MITKPKQFLHRTEEFANEQQTFSILKRSPKGARPSKMVRARYLLARACLKKWCFKSFSELGRFFGSFTKQVATNSLKACKEKRKSLDENQISNRCFKVFSKHHKPLKISCLFHNQDQEGHFVKS